MNRRSYLRIAGCSAVLGVAGCLAGESDGDGTGETVTTTTDDGADVTDERLFGDAFGRLRTAFVGPEDDLYVTTSNRDGRGRPGENDDRLLGVVPA